MSSYTRLSDVTKTPFGRAWSGYARTWFDQNLEGDELALVKSVYPFLWADGYANPPGGVRQAHGVGRAVVGQTQFRPVHADVHRLQGVQGVCRPAALTCTERAGGDF